MATTNMRIVIRRDTAANWAANGGPTLLRGEQGYETDTGKMKVGDNVTRWVDLPYFNGGITGYDTVTIQADNGGQISLNKTAVLGSGIDTVTVQDYVDSKDAILANAISEEAVLRANDDTALGVRIDGLTTDLSDSVDALVSYNAGQDSLIDANAVAIVAERDARLFSDSAFGTKLDDSVAALLAADVVLTDGLAAEVTARENGDSAGAIALSDSVAALLAADVVLTDGLAATDAALADEVTARENGDSAGAIALSDSVAALLSADVDLTNAIALEHQYMLAGDTVTAQDAQAALEDSVTALIAADAAAAVALEDSVTALEAADAAAAVALEDSVTALEAADAALESRPSFVRLGSRSSPSLDGVTDGSIVHDATTGEVFIALNDGNNLNGYFQIEVTP